MRTAFGFLIILLGLAAFAAYNSYFIVSQIDQAIVLRLGEPVKVVKKPGLNFKLPLIETVTYFDKRILDLDTPVEEVIASDQKRLLVDSFARYKITDPLQFLQTIGDPRFARDQLGPILNSALRQVLGEATLQEVVRDKRDPLMQQIERRVNTEANRFGVDIVDVRIKRADLPPANEQAIYKRMQTERVQEAEEIRAEGREISQRIRATADRQVTVLKANAERDAQKIRGDGDAKRNEIFAKAYGGEAAEFFKFYRSMQAYETGLGADKTRILLSPDSEFFSYFKNPAGSPSP